MNERENRTPAVGAVERRVYGGAHVELREDGEKRGIRGVGIPVGPVADIGYFTEEIDPGALDDVLAMDVRGLYNHDDNYVLGRTGSANPTMTMKVTSDGVVYDIPEMPKSRADVMEAIQRGDVDGSSHSFIVKEDAWTREEGKKPHRRILQYERVFDMGPVVFPAYEGDATVSARSLRAAADSGAEIPADVLADAEARADVEAEKRAMSDEDLRSLLDDALERQAIAGDADWIWVADVYSSDGYLVFRTSGSDALERGYYRAAYEIDEQKSVTFGDPVRVRRRTIYEDVAPDAGDGSRGEDGGPPAEPADEGRASDPPVEVRVVPRDVSTEIVTDRATAWSAPSLNDFTENAWDDLADADKRKIAGHFAWSRSGAVPDRFSDLALPHHRASDGRVVWRGLVAAAARLDQTEGVDVDAARAHLAAHYEAFDETAPWDRSAGADAEIAELRERIEAIADANRSLTARVARAEREVERLRTLSEIEGAIPG